jgi:hypothetical protein
MRSISTSFADSIIFISRVVGKPDLKGLRQAYP